MHQKERYKQAKKVTLIGALINALLGLIKLIGGVFFHSHALVADGVHSFSDLITDVMVLFASKYGSHDADDTHPYGHQRIETAATLFLSLVLILAGAGITWDSLNEIIHKSHDMPGWLALPIAVLSILANEGLFHYTQLIGKRIQSDLIIANAWHHRSDAASSVVVLIGLIGSLAGIVSLDAIAAVVVGLMVIHMGWSYGWNSVKELVDTAVESELIHTIEHIIRQVNGVQKIHQLRSRMMGRDIFIDVHIQVPPHLSVSEGHYIAQHVHQALMNKVEQIKDVTEHVDPEDDEAWALRKGMSVEEYPEIQSWVLHYLDGALMIDLLCDAKFSEWKALSEKINTDLKEQPQRTNVRLYVQHEEITQ